MAQTLTSTAYAETPRSLHANLFTHGFNYTTPAGLSLSASANSLVILGPRIMDQTWILGVIGSHSSGAATCPVDVGYDDTISAIASQMTQGANAIGLKTTVPLKITITDTTVTRYVTTKFGVTPGTDTTVINIKYNFLLSRDNLG